MSIDQCDKIVSMSGHSKWSTIKRQKGKVFLFVDGTNLYAGQHELFGADRYLDFPLFIKKIEKKLKIVFDKIYFYASYSPKPKKITVKIKDYLKNEQFFYKSVKKTPNIFFFKGYRSKTSSKEKEVDVKLGVDVVDMAHRNLYNNLFLFSGDADFMHAIKIAESLNKKAQILALENRIPVRFSYHYPAYIFVVKSTGRIEKKLNKKQKIKTIYVNEVEIVRQI